VTEPPNSRPDTTNPSERLAAVLIGAGDEGVAAWSATGRAGVVLLHQVLVEGRDIPTPGTHSRDVIDNLAEAVVSIASAEPDAFLEVFADPALDTNSFVLAGLGRVLRPAATRRLVAASAAGDMRLRQDAAMALGHHASPEAVSALVTLLDDPDYLVRYHALQSLAAVGDVSALPALEAIDPPHEIERTLATDAVAAIHERRHGADRRGRPTG
jgi:HEAT repeat protein